MNSFTIRQRNAMQGKSLAERQRLSNIFRQQNSQNRMFNTNIRTTTQFRNPNYQNTRFNQANVITRSPINSLNRGNNMRSRRGENRLRPDTRGLVNQLAATVCLTQIQTTSANQIVTTVAPVHPRMLIGATHHVQMFAEWAYESIQIRFVGTAAQNHSGIVVIGYSDNFSPAPTSLARLLAFPNTQRTSIQETSQWQSLPLANASRWYNMGATSDSTSHYNSNPFHFLIGGVANFVGTLGFVECRYNLKFRTPKSVNATPSGFTFQHGEETEQIEVVEDNDDDQLDTENDS